MLINHTRRITLECENRGYTTTQQRSGDHGLVTIKVLIKVGKGRSANSPDANPEAVVVKVPSTGRPRLTYLVY